MNRILENFTKVATVLGLILIIKIFLETCVYYIEILKLYS